MNLKSLITQLDKPVITGTTDRPVAGITDDSKQVRPDYVFVAIRGSLADGHHFIDSALNSAATTIIAETPPPNDLDIDLTWIQVSDSRHALALMAAAYFDYPADPVKLTGITGTNGKTTTAFILHQLLRRHYLRAGLIGTIKLDNGLEQTPAELTTPGPIALQEFFSEIRDNGCLAAVMEVSSHALHQKRVAGLKFDVGVFTNLSQDHLDYHPTMEAYFEAKCQLFRQLAQHHERKPCAVINHDDARASSLIQLCKSLNLRILTYGEKPGADMRASKVRIGMKGSSFELDYRDRQYLVRTPLIGHFNIANTLAALAAATAQKLSLRDCIKAVADLPQVPGRLEWIASRRGTHVFVDYAHTPDALENVCSTLKNLEPERLITVFGCGGDRDRSKRPLMAAAAEKFSDFTLVTSDNPRTEDPETIIKEITKGIQHGRHATITDRAQAIEAALRFAKPNDIVLVAGKGHEPYQEIMGERKPFHDTAVIKSCLFRIEKEFQADLAVREAERAERMRQREEQEGDEKRPRTEPAPRPPRQPRPQQAPHNRPDRKPAQRRESHRGDGQRPKNTPPEPNPKQQNFHFRDSPKKTSQPENQGTDSPQPTNDN